MSFGSMTGELKSYGKIGLTNAVGFSQVRVNDDLLRGFDTGCKNKNTKRVERISHDISEEKRVSLVKMCIEDVLAARAVDQLDMYKQLTEKRSK